MAVGRRCDMGCENVDWPDEPIYWKCPYCGEQTSRCSNLSPIDSEEARSILRHQAFDRFYAEYCRRKGQTADGDIRESAQVLKARAIPA